MKLPARHQSEMSERYLPFPRLARAPKVATEAARGKVGLGSPSQLAPLPRAVLEGDRFPSERESHTLTVCTVTHCLLVPHNLQGSLGLPAAAKCLASERLQAGENDFTEEIG